MKSLNPHSFKIEDLKHSKIRKMEELSLNKYQEQAMTTCTDSSRSFSHMALNLQGEVGEFMGKVAKAIRKGELRIDEDQHLRVLPFGADGSELERSLALEAGDILWQLAGLCHVCGWDLEAIAQMNLDKLQARKTAGTIVGSGDGVNGNDRKIE